jgi:hypothetical protein
MASTHVGSARRWTAGLVIGSILGLVALGLLTAGGALTDVYPPFRLDQGGGESPRQPSGDSEDASTG